MSDHMPYVRDGERCDICGALLVAGRIRRVEREPAREPSPDGSRPYRAARVIIVCDRHQLDADRPPGPALTPGRRHQPQATAT